MTLQEQIKDDSEYRKKTNKKGLFDIAIGFVMILDFVLHLIPYTKSDADEFIIIFIKCVMTFIIVRVYLLPFYNVIENAAISAYADKFMFVPIDKKVFIKSKVIIATKFCCKLAVAFMIANTIGLLAEKQFYLSIRLFVPVYIIFIILLEEIFAMHISYRKL